MSRRSGILLRQARALAVLLALVLTGATAADQAPRATRAPAVTAWISGLWAALARLWAPVDHLFQATCDPATDPTCTDGGLGPGSGGGYADPNGST